MQTRFYPVLPSSVWPFLQKSVDDWTSCSNTFRYLGTRSIRLFFMMVPWTGNCARQTDTDTVDKKRFATILFRSCRLPSVLAPLAILHDQVPETSCVRKYADSGRRLSVYVVQCRDNQRSIFHS